MPPDQDRNKKVFLIVCVVLAVFVWGRLGRSRQSTQETVSFKAIADNAASFSLKERAKSSYSDWGRNPFVIQAAPIQEGLVLQGILWDQENPKALIKDKIVGRGDSIDGDTVVDIKLDYVILNNGLHDYELRLGSQNSKSP